MEVHVSRQRLEDPGRALAPLPVTTDPANPGASVLTIGFPHVDVMSRSPKLTTGVIDARAVYHSSGDLPRNVNYAVKSEHLGGWAARDVTGSAGGRLETETLVPRVRDSVFIVIAH